MKTIQLASAVSLVLGLLASGAIAATPTPEQMWEIIQQQQEEIRRLKEQVASTRQEVEQTSEKIEATATMVEEQAGGGAASSWVERTSLGGYGEMHYNNLDNKNGDSGDVDEIDFHRFVLFIGHEFSKKTRFFSEIELEHSLAGDGKPGEVELEQAYIEHDLSSTTQLKAGLFLMPVGLLNLTHEPNTFLRR